jgi:hypothetical protein
MSIMANPSFFLVFILAIATIILGASSDFNKQFVSAQNETKDNKTEEDTVGGSGSISSLPTPIRPPFA